MDSNKIAIFQKIEIRKVIYENEWWFVINDVIAALTDSADPVQYFKRMKSRDPELKILTEQGGGYNLYHPLCWRLKQPAENKECIAGIRRMERRNRGIQTKNVIPAEAGIQLFLIYVFVMLLFSQRQT